MFSFTRHGQKLLLQCFFDTFLTGLAAHAAFFFGNLSFHDDVVCTYDVGATHIFGRFTLGLLGKLTRIPFGGSNYSLPWFNGFLSLAFLALSAFLILRFLGITSRVLSFLLCGILAVFPVLTATFAYGFTAPYYMFAFLLAVLGAVLLVRGKSPASFAAGILVSGLMIGIYQAYLPIMLTMEVLLLLADELSGFPCQSAYSVSGPSAKSVSCPKAFSTRKDTWMFVWIRSLAGTGLGFCLYLVLMKLSLSLTGKELYAYRGLDTLGGGGNFSYPARILMAYRMFFNPDSFAVYRGSDDYLLFMWSMRAGYRLLVVLIFLLLVSVLFLQLKQRKKQGLPAFGFLIRSLVLFLLFPLCANFIFVMTDFDVYSLMLYGEVMIFVLALFLAGCLLPQEDFAPLFSALFQKEKASVSAEKTTSSGRAFPLPAGSLPGIFSLLAAGILAFAVLFYIRYDNLCYYKAGRMQEEAIAYDTALVSRIQSTEGYEPSLPVCFVHGLEKDTSFLADDPELLRVALTPYNGSEIINDYSWVSFLRIHCGYAPAVIEDAGQYDGYLEQEQIPRYPAPGSIRVLDDVILVNF